MFSVLLKKQFKSFAYALRPMNKKTGKRASVGGGIAMMILLLFGGLSISFGFVGAGELLLPTYISLDITWLYFSIMGLISILFGTVGNVFSLYSGLFKAKDNELLLSMPIKPGAILLSRMVFDYLLSVLYTAIAWVPSVIMFAVKSETLNVAALVIGLLFTFILALFCIVLGCILAWIVAMIASKVTSKIPVVIFSALAIFGIYYFIYFKVNDFLTSLQENAVTLAKTFDQFANPIYILGKMGTGDIISALIIGAAIIALFVLTYYILSKTFLSIAIKNNGSKKKEYHRTSGRSSSMGKTLLKREFKHFLSSVPYMLNCALGTLLIPILCIVLVVKSGDLLALFNEFSSEVPIINSLLPVILFTIVTLVSSMNMITNPSVSLEGKTLWIIQSMPTELKKVLRAKLLLHIIITSPVVLIACIILSIVLSLNVFTAILATIATLAFMCLSALMGLFVNLRRANVNWTDETEAIKRDVSSLLILLGEWFVSIVIAAVYLPVCFFINPTIYLSIISLILIGVDVLIYNSIMKKGPALLMRL